MLEMKITVTAADLAAAINNLATALSARTETTPTGTPNGATPFSNTCAAAETDTFPTIGSQPATEKENAAAAPKQTGAPLQTPAQNFAGTTTPANTVVPNTPDTPTVPATGSVPTAAPQYTLEMLATAGSALIDAGKMDLLMGLLAKFGVASLTDLAPNTYGAMAQELRALGAKI